MNEVELAVRQFVALNVVDVDGEVRTLELTQHRRVEIGRYDRSLGAHAVAEPRGDRATAGPDLQAPPPAIDAQRVEVLDRPTVERLLECVQALAL